MATRIFIRVAATTGGGTIAISTNSFAQNNYPYINIILLSIACRLVCTCEHGGVGPYSPILTFTDHKKLQLHARKECNAYNTTELPW